MILNYFPFKEDLVPLTDGSSEAEASNHSVCSPLWPGSPLPSDL